MAKRKLVTLSRRPARNVEETDSSDSGQIIAKKRFRRDPSPDNTDDQEQYNSANDDEADSSSSSYVDENQSSEDDDHPFHSTLQMLQDRDSSFRNERDFRSDSMNNSQYDGYQSFMNSFQFLSDEESCDSDSPVTPRYIRSPKKNGTRKTEWLPQPDDQPMTKNKLRLMNLSENVQVIGYYIGNLEVVFMDHPSSVPIIGYLQVTLIAGKASIQGYTLKIGEPVKVFSQKQTGILEVNSHYCEEEQVCAMQNNVRLQLSENLVDVGQDTIKDLIKKYMSYSSTVLILQSCPLPPQLEFLQLYSPFATSFQKRNKDAVTRYVAYMEKEENILRFGHEYEEIFTTIHKHLLKINRRKPGQPKVKVDDSEMDFSSAEEDLENCTKKITGFRILISGPKKAGKSTMLRYLVNCFLNKYPEVYYLDTDPGQTEFTPPGTVSLVKVTEPVFGPPYTHLRKPVKSVFTGSITPESSPPMHMKSIDKMINYFNSNFPDSVLLVNTIGWLTGTGDVIYQHIKGKLMAAVEIHLDPGLAPLKISVEGRFLKCTVGFERDAASSTKQGDNRPADLRDWTILAYLGGCQVSYLQPQTLNALRPVCICWDDIAVYNFSKRLTYCQYFDAIVNSIVALCHVNKNMILAPNPKYKDYPITLMDEPDNDCYGYGYVRAIDKVRHLLYIVTPLAQNILNCAVNAILCGNVIVPRSVICEQEIYDVEIPFTDVSKQGGNELRKAIRKRSRGHSSNDRAFYPR